MAANATDNMDLMLAMSIQKVNTLLIAVNSNGFGKHSDWHVMSVF